MDYKDKYEMALEGIQEILGSGEDSIKMSRLQLRLQGIFPELSESEDERIRKDLIKLVEESTALREVYDLRKMSAWLEKQGEQSKWKPSKDEMDALYGLAYITNKMDDKKDESVTKLYQDLKREFFNGESYENMFSSSPVNSDINIEKQGEHAKFRDSIQVGDKVTRNQDGMLVNLSQLNRVAKKHGEQKPANKVEPKFKVGDVIRLKGSAAEYTIKKVTDTTYYTNGWSCGIERCEEDYELVEQKPAEWSEEDEKILSNIIKDLVHPWNEYIPDRIEDEIKWLKNKLKSLRPQFSWKPSDEQLYTLEKATHIVGSKYKSCLTSLYEDLKKLKGE